MTATERRRKILEEAWVGDSVLCLYARLKILRENGEVDGAKFIRMTSNKFLAAIGDPSEVEAELGRMYLQQGLKAAFKWIDDHLARPFDRQEQNRLAGTPGTRTPAVRRKPSP